MVRVEINILEVKFKIDLLEDSVSSHVPVPAKHITKSMHVSTLVQSCLQSELG